MAKSKSSQPYYAPGSFFVLKYHDDADLPKGPLIYKLLEQKTDSPPYWVRADVNQLGEQVVRGGDSNKLEGNLSPDSKLYCTFDSPVAYKEAVAGLTTEGKKLATFHGKNTIVFPLESQPSLLTNSMHRAEFGLQPPSLTPTR